MFASLLLALTLAPAPDSGAAPDAAPDASTPSSAPAPGIAPGRMTPPPSTVRIVRGHRLVQQADGSWTNVDREHDFVARIGVDGQLEFSRAPTGGRPNHPWYVQARDPITGQPTGRVAGSTLDNAGDAGDAIGALLAAGLFKGLEIRSDRRHAKPNVSEPLDARDRFALDTADFRAQLAVRWYDARLQESLEKLDGDLRTLWSDAIEPKTRRMAVFELWLRFPEQLPHVPLHPPPDVRRELQTRREAIGAVGRDLVREFVRTYLPRGSAEGYSRGELRRLNENRPLDPFDPYARPRSPPSTPAR